MLSNNSVYLLCALVKINLYQNVFKIHLFHSKYTTSPLKYLLTFCLRLTDINIIIKLYVEYFVLHSELFLILSQNVF